jgi:hypothetical protein
MAVPSHGRPSAGPSIGMMGCVRIGRFPSPEGAGRL